MRRFKFSLIILFLLVTSSMISEAKPRELPLDFQLRMLLPPKDSIGGVTMSREPEFYNRGNLTSYIKEGNDLLYEYGFIALLVTGYFKSGEIITVEIYKMADYRGAYGLFTTNKIPREGELKAGDGCLRSKSSAIFWQDQYLIKLISLGRSEVPNKAIDSIAKMISQRIGVHKKTPQSAAFFPTKDLLADSIRYVMGPVGFKRYFPFLPSEVFDNKANVSEAFVSNYKDQKNLEFFYTLIKFSSYDKAGQVLDNITEALKKNSINHFALFNVVSYKMNEIYFKVDRIGNYLSIFRYLNKDFKYEWYLDRVKENITVKSRS